MRRVFAAVIRLVLTVWIYCGISAGRISGEFHAVKSDLCHMGKPCNSTNHEEDQQIVLSAVFSLLLDHSMGIWCLQGGNTHAYKSIQQCVDWTAGAYAMLMHGLHYRAALFYHFEKKIKVVQRAFHPMAIKHPKTILSYQTLICYIYDEGCFLNYCR